jgi:hypothetical protein
LSAIPNKINEPLIIASATAPNNIFFDALFNILKVKIFTATTPAITRAPNNAFLPFSATLVRISDVTNIIPVNAVNINAVLTAFLIFLLFLESVLAIGTNVFTNTPNSNAPNIPAAVVTIDAVKNIDSIQEEYKDKYDEFYERFCSLEDGNASKRIVERIWGK